MPKHKFQLFLERCLNHPLSSVVIFLAILLTALQVVLDFLPNPTPFFSLLAQVLFIFTQSIFILEILIRILVNGTQLSLFFRDRRNVIDLSLVVLSLLPLPAQWAPMVRILRSLRIIRIISIPNYFQKFQSNLWSFRLALVLSGFLIITGLFVHRISFVSNSSVTSGKVSAIFSYQRICGTKAATRKTVSYEYCPQFEAVVDYIASNDQKLNVTLLNGIRKPLHQVGTQVEIVYQKSNPRVATFNSFWDIWQDPIIAMVLFFILIISDLYLTQVAYSLFTSFRI